MSSNKEIISIILPTYNERQNVEPIINELLGITGEYRLEIIVVDDDSPDGTAEKVRELAHIRSGVRLVRRVGRAGLASAIKEGLLDATGDIAVCMDCDGQHEPATVRDGIQALIEEQKQLIIGSRFHKKASINGLSSQRRKGSNYANQIARFSLHKNYAHLTDYMSGFFVMRLDSVTLPAIRGVEVNGFKFLYELLAISRGRIQADEIPLNFQSRTSGESKLDLAIFWDFLISAIHTMTLRLVPRRAISFGIVGATGFLVQLATTFISMKLISIPFQAALPTAVILAASSNYLINNALTFRSNRLENIALAKGLLKFLIVSSLPVIANIGIARTFYTHISSNIALAQLVGVIVAFAWNYVASSKFVWNTP